MRAAPPFYPAMAGSTQPPTVDDSDGPRFTVAFQGETGAYSEASIFELLGQNCVKAVPFPSFDDAFAACSARKVDMLQVPIENSLGGTIHANCDLQLRHSLFIIAEHDFRVRHCLMALPGTKREDLKKVISHPQALAQCDSYLKRHGLRPEPAYDTAGSAKMISEGKLEGVAAICSEHAAKIFGLEILDRGIEDDANNFTRFLLLRTAPVRVPPSVKCKTSVVFSLENSAGALFKALSVFSLRDIDLTKIESRPCKPDVMDKLERLFWGMGGGMLSGHRHFQATPIAVEDEADAPDLKKRRTSTDSLGSISQTKAHYRYLFYVDFKAPADEPNSANALKHLQEITTFFRILGSYPCGGAVHGLGDIDSKVVMPVSVNTKQRKRVGVLGFGNFGQFLAKRLVTDFDVFATSRRDYSSTAQELGVGWCLSTDELVSQRLDVLLLCVSVLSFEEMVRQVATSLKSMKIGEDGKKLLVADVCSVKAHPKTTMLGLLPGTCDLLCTHPMFGPQSALHGWTNMPFVYERVRCQDAGKCDEFLKWWEEQGCRMVAMSCEEHDEISAGSQFVTHFTGRVLDKLQLQTTPINTKGFEALLQLTDHTCRDSMDLFAALYRFNPNSAQELKAFGDAVAQVSKDLEGKNL